MNQILLRLSPPEDQAGVTHAISPIWMKLGQIKGPKIPPKKASKLNIAPRYRIQWILFVFNIIKDWTCVSLHPQFQVIWSDRCQSKAFNAYPCHERFSNEVKCLNFWSKYRQSATFFFKTIFITVQNNPWPDKIVNKIFGICYVLRQNPFEQCD